MKFKLVKIEWLDAIGVTTEWEDRKMLRRLKPSKCVSVGFLVDDGDEFKTIAQSVEKNHILGRQSIPVGCILKITKLRG